MGLLDRLLGREPRDGGQYGQYTAPSGQQYAPQSGPPSQQAHAAPQQAHHLAHRSPDEVAIDRYRYLLRTAPPDAVEQAHAEAFARLTPEQRRQVLAELGDQVPAAERAATDSPQDLARMATRAEMRDPGTMERTFSGRGGAPGFGAMVGSSLLGTIAGVVIGSAVANALFGPAFADPTQAAPQDAAPDGGDTDGEGSDTDQGGADQGGDVEAADAGGADGWGGDLGGGFEDFGGFGDF